MITLERDGVRMEVCTELQASAFVKNGYTKVEDVVAEESVVSEEPKRRRRKTKAEAEETA